MLCLNHTSEAFSEGYHLYMKSFNKVIWMGLFSIPLGNFTPLLDHVLVSISVPLLLIARNGT